MSKTTYQIIKDTLPFEVTYRHKYPLDILSGRARIKNGDRLFVVGIEQLETNEWCYQIDLYRAGMLALVPMGRCERYREPVPEFSPMSTEFYDQNPTYGKY